MYCIFSDFAGNVSQTELFGQPNDTAMQAVCPPCYRPDLGQKLWGFATVLLNMSAIITGTHPSLFNLSSLGYQYAIYRSANVTSTTPDIIIRQSEDGLDLSKMYVQLIAVPNSQVRSIMGLEV